MSCVPVSPLAPRMKSRMVTRPGSRIACDRKEQDERSSRALRERPSHARPAPHEGHAATPEQQRGKLTRGGQDAEGPTAESDDGAALVAQRLAVGRDEVACEDLSPRVERKGPVGVASG